MGAEVGDEVVVGSSDPDEPGRIGIIVALDQDSEPDDSAAPGDGGTPEHGGAPEHGDGSPRYVIHWLVGDYDSRVFPGPGLRIKLQHKAGSPGRPADAR
jgi:hypothetical protein